MIEPLLNGIECTGTSELIVCHLTIHEIARKFSDFSMYVDTVVELKKQPVTRKTGFYSTFSTKFESHGDILDITLLDQHTFVLTSSSIYTIQDNSILEIQRLQPMRYFKIVAAEKDVLLVYGRRYVGYYNLERGMLYEYSLHDSDVIDVGLVDSETLYSFGEDRRLVISELKNGNVKGKISLELLKLIKDKRTKKEFKKKKLYSCSPYRLFFRDGFFFVFYDNSLLTVWNLDSELNLKFVYYVEIESGYICPTFQSSFLLLTPKKILLEFDINKREITNRIKLFGTGLNDLSCTENFAVIKGDNILIFVDLQEFVIVNKYDTPNLRNLVSLSLLSNDVEDIPDVILGGGSKILVYQKSSPLIFLDNGQLTDFKQISDELERTLQRLGRQTRGIHDIFVGVTFTDNPNKCYLLTTTAILAKWNRMEGRSHGDRVRLKNFFSAGTPFMRKNSSQIILQLLQKLLSTSSQNRCYFCMAAIDPGSSTCAFCAKGTAMCVMCKKQLVSTDKIIVCDNCWSAGHHRCLGEYLKVTGICPTCRTKIRI